MSRSWGKQFAHMLGHPKYLRASIEERSAWHTLFLVALNSPTAEVLGSRADVEALLRNYGHGEQALARLDALVRLRLVDVRRSVYKLHDWGDWQPDDPTGAKRKERERERRKSQAEDVTVNGLSRDSLVLEERENQSREDSPNPNPFPAGKGRNGRSTRTRAATGTDASQYERATKRDSDTEPVAVSRPDWADQ